MDRKYYTGEQILDALSEVGVGAGDISEVMSCLGRRELGNNSAKVDRKNDNLISRQNAIDALWELRRNIQMMDNSQGADIVLHGVYLAEKKIQSLPSAEPNLQSNLQPTCNQLATEIIRCKDCKHRFLQNGIWQCPFTIPASENHFCGYAERREDE